MIVLVHASTLIIISSFFYLSLTSSHIYLYFLIIALTASILKKYVYVTYIIYLNFYWVFCFLFIFYSLTCTSVVYLFGVYTVILFFV